jgi:hypothetical protein
MMESTMSVTDMLYIRGMVCEKFDHNLMRILMEVDPTIDPTRLVNSLTMLHNVILLKVVPPYGNAKTITPAGSKLFDALIPSLKIHSIHSAFKGVFFMNRYKKSCQTPDHRKYLKIFKANGLSFIYLKYEGSYHFLKAICEYLAGGAYPVMTPSKP